MSAVGNDEYPGAGTLLTVKCSAPGTYRVSNARGLPGGMLADGIDSYITRTKTVLLQARF